MDQNGGTCMEGRTVACMAKQVDIVYTQGHPHIVIHDTHESNPQESRQRIEEKPV